MFTILTKIIIIEKIENKSNGLYQVDNRNTRR